MIWSWFNLRFQFQVNKIKFTINFLSKFSKSILSQNIIDTGQKISSFEILKHWNIDNSRNINQGGQSQKLQTTVNKNVILTRVLALLLM